MKSIVDNANQVIDYLATRGFVASELDKSEILARMNGYASAEEEKAHAQRAGQFAAYVGVLEDFDADRYFSGVATLATTPLCHSVDKETAIQAAKSHAHETGWFAAVYDGNGRLVELLDPIRDSDIAVYSGLDSAISNPEVAKFKDLVSDEEFNLEDAGLLTWRGVGGLLAWMRENPRDNQQGVDAKLFVVAVGDVGRNILWRGRV